MGVGLERRVDHPHLGREPHVELFPLHFTDPEEADDTGDAEESWFTASELNWARALARKVRHWTTGGLYLDAKGRPAEPGDVMILLRSRSDLARLIVSRLYEEQVAEFKTKLTQG